VLRVCWNLVSIREMSSGNERSTLEMFFAHSHTPNEKCPAQKSFRNVNSRNKSMVVKVFVGDWNKVRLVS